MYFIQVDKWPNKVCINVQFIEDSNPAKDPYISVQLKLRPRGSASAACVHLIVDIGVIHAPLFHFHFACSVVDLACRIHALRTDVADLAYECDLCDLCAVDFEFCIWMSLGRAEDLFDGYWTEGLFGVVALVWTKQDKRKGGNMSDPSSIVGLIYRGPMVGDWV